MSQSDLGSAIGVSLRTVQLYEKEGANIPIKNLTKIADYFEMGIDELYSREVNEANGVYRKERTDSKKGHSISKLGPGKYLLSAPLIMESQHEIGSKNFEDLIFINSLPHIGFMVDQVSVGNYLAFEISNNSMDNGLTDGISKGSVVLGKRVAEKELHKKLEEEDSNWILICAGTIMCKKITAFDKKKKSIACHSLNNSPEYPDFEVLIGEVLAFYKILKKQVD